MEGRRTKSGIPIWLLGFLLIAVVVAVGTYNYVEQQKYRQLHVALEELQREIESYAVDNEGSYPDSLEQLIAERKISLDRNPFSRGKLKILQRGEPAQAGGIVYAAGGPLVKTGGEANPNLRMDNDHYILVAYGPRKRKLPEPASVQVSPLYEGIDWSYVVTGLSTGLDDILYLIP